MKKLLVVLGAGASIEFGMPNVDKIDNLFEKWSKWQCPITKSGHMESLYGWVKQNVESYNTKKLNFENTLHTIQTISSLGLSKDYGSSNLANFITVKDFPEIQLPSGVTKIAEGDDFAMLNKVLNDKLLKYLRDKGNILSIDNEIKLNSINKFFNFLRNDFQLGFVNLNYDNVLLSALPELSTGFDIDTGKFDMNNFYQDKWDFCYHLHGSVHFDMRDTQEEIFWNDDLSEKFGYGAANRRGYTTPEGAYHPLSTIITGLDKINQIYRQPFRQYFLKLDQRIYESDSILFIGYGFNDSYINELIRTHCEDKSKRRNIVVLDYQDNETRSLSEGGNEWGYRLLNTTYVANYEMGNGSTNLIYRPDKVSEYRKNGSFEFSSDIDNPLYVWYSGFLDACGNGEKVKNALMEYARS